jgi:hypothetical protein
MKIGSNLLSNINSAINSASRKVRKKNIPNNLAVANPKISFKGSASTLSQEREVAAAMMLAQKARTIIQEALRVSSEISSLAMTTLATGELDYSRLSLELSQINDLFEEQGLTVSMPPISTAIKNDGFPEINSEVSQLQAMLDKREIVAQGVDKIADALTEKSLQADEIFKRFERKLEISTETFRSVDNPHKKISLIRSQITTKPETALMAQGNINNDKMGHLLR